MGRIDEIAWPGDLFFFFRGIGELSCPSRELGRVWFVTSNLLRENNQFLLTKIEPPAGRLVIIEDGCTPREHSSVAVMPLVGG